MDMLKDLDRMRFMNALIQFPIRKSTGSTSSGLLLLSDIPPQQRLLVDDDGKHMPFIIQRQALLGVDE